jgi:alkaline phosphatase D
VASGDPLADRVILWTRVTSPGARAADVAWRVARDPEMRQVVARGTARATPDRDFTVKVDAAGLEPGTTYFYRFDALEGQSPIGRTKTAGRVGVSRLRLALVSCANYPVGFFNAYARLAERPDIDAVLHLGDYIYEYGIRPDDHGEEKGRSNRPAREIVTLADYRDRYALYREDRDLQECHRQHPFIVVWDDHEFANDAWTGGSENHNPERGEGDWAARRAAATRAYLEWLPIREQGLDAQGHTHIYRTFHFGGLADVIMLDSRMDGRVQQVTVTDASAVDDPARSMLGFAQERWLEGQLAASSKNRVLWQLLGQQVMFAPQSVAGQPAATSDSWDGYRAARARLLETVERLRLPNFVVFTGDVHSSWANDIARNPFDPAAYDPVTGRGAVGVEIVAPAVTSGNGFGEGEVLKERVAGVLARRPHTRFLDGQYRGYVLVDVTPRRLQAEWWFVPTVAERTPHEMLGKRLTSAAGRPHLFS